MIGNDRTEGCPSIQLQPWSFRDVQIFGPNIGPNIQSEHWSEHLVQTSDHIWSDWSEQLKHPIIFDRIWSEIPLWSEDVRSPRYLWSFWSSDHIWSGWSDHIETSDHNWSDVSEQLKHPIIFDRIWSDLIGQKVAPLSSNLYSLGRTHIRWLLCCSDGELLRTQKVLKEDKSS